MIGKGIYGTCSSASMNGRTRWVCWSRATVPDNGRWYWKMAARCRYGSPWSRWNRLRASRSALTHRVENGPVKSGRYRCLCELPGFISRRHLRCRGFSEFCVPGTQNFEIDKGLVRLSHRLSTKNTSEIGSPLEHLLYFAASGHQTGKGYPRGLPGFSNLGSGRGLS